MTSTGSPAQGRARRDHAAGWAVQRWPESQCDFHCVLGRRFRCYRPHSLAESAISVLCGFSGEYRAHVFGILALAVFLGHLYMAVVDPPPVRPFMDRVRHGQALMGRATIQIGLSRTSRSHRYVLGPSCDPARSSLLGLEAALLLSRFGLEWLGANVTDPVTKLIYQYSGLPGTLQAPVRVLARLTWQP